MRTKLDRVVRARPAATEREGTPSALTTRVAGTCWSADATTGRGVGGTFEDAVFAVTGFRCRDATLRVTGTLSGTCTAGDGAPGSVFAAVVTAQATIEVARSPAACVTLRVLVEPIDADLRGLVIHADEFVVAVTATTGPGNLFGNLIAAVGSASSGRLPTTHLADLLNLVVALAG